MRKRQPESGADITMLRDLERKVLWLASWMIHNANHLRDNEGSVKVGGHQASSASMVSIMTALYFSVLRPADRVAVKPHASPVFHAIQYLLGNQTREKLENFRGFGGAQSYPSRTKDIDDVDFSTGSVGLGAAFTAFSSLVQDYIAAKGWVSEKDTGRMIALLGDAELDEGNIYECLLEGWKHGLRNSWWIVDYNRQSLDGVAHEGLYDRIAETFRAFGWDVVTLKYGELQQAAFEEKGGEALRQWIDDCPNSLYCALTYQGGDAWRQRIAQDLGDDADVMALLDRRSDAELGALMANLGGHCLPSLIRNFNEIDHDRPVCFIAYTIKGWGLPLAGHKDNHAGIMTPEQMIDFKSQMGIRDGCEWGPAEGLATSSSAVASFLSTVPFNAQGTRRHQAAKLAIENFPVIAGTRTSTQEGFGKILNEIARSEAPYADRIITTSPDVTVSTNLGAWVNRRNLFAREAMVDVFREEKVVSGQKWSFSAEGQHMELGIAENNLFLMLGAAGLAHSLYGERLLPVGTVYDPFISRGLDALNYACYQDARFMLMATPSGVTLAPEGGAHQSITTPLIGMAQDGLASFEPAFVDELAVIMEWGFDYMQRDGAKVSNEDDLLADAAGGAVYIRGSTLPIEQIKRPMDEERRRQIIDGAYWLRPPGPNCELVIAYQGVVAPEAIAAAGLASEDRRDVGVLAVTSADRLNAGWQAAQSLRRNGSAFAISHIEQLLQPVGRDAAIVTVHDGHPAALSWLGGVQGNMVAAHGVTGFGQTGTVKDLHRHFEIDAEAILRTANAISPGHPVRYVPLAAA